jgi:hypothetical protein
MPTKHSSLFALLNVFIAAVFVISIVHYVEITNPLSTWKSCPTEL